MPVFQFTFGPPTAGCVAKVILKTPWDRPVREQPSQHFPQGRILNPPEAACAWLGSYGAQQDQYGNPVLLFPPGSQPLIHQIGNEHGPAQVLAIEPYPPIVDRQQVNAPYGQPVGNGRSFALPPEQPKPNAPRAVPMGMYEPLADCAVTLNSDSLMGDSDGEGGTYTDIDSMGNEVVRQLAMPQGPRVTDRR